MPLFEMEHGNYYLPIPVKMLWVVNGFSTLNKILMAILTGTSLVLNLRLGDLRFFHQQIEVFVHM